MAYTLVVGHGTFSDKGKGQILNIGLSERFQGQIAILVHRGQGLQGHCRVKYQVLIRLDLQAQIIL